jgi:hypothetical protein
LSGFVERGGEQAHLGRYPQPLSTVVGGQADGFPERRECRHRERQRGFAECDLADEYLDLRYRPQLAGDVGAELGGLPQDGIRLPGVDRGEHAGQDRARREVGEDALHHDRQFLVRYGGDLRVDRSQFIGRNVVAGPERVARA